MVAIVNTKGVVGGKPRISGTRMSVDIIGSYLACGYGVREIERDYPHLSHDQIKAALSYIGEKVAKEGKNLEPQTP